MQPMSSENPYQVAVDVDHSETVPVTESLPARPTIISWVIVFLLNLPIPVFFGSSVVASASGYTGMAVGCVLWCGLGILLCFGQQAKHIQATTRGGLLVALSQFYPILHMFAGLLAGAVVAAVFGAGNSGRGPLNMTTNQVFTDLLHSTAMTLVTGALLIFVAFTVGHLVSFVVRAISENR